jgi:hypothetical protein
VEEHVGLSLASLTARSVRRSRLAFLVDLAIAVVVQPVADLPLGDVSWSAAGGSATVVCDTVAVVVDAISADLLARAARADALGPGAEFAVEEARLRAADAGPNPREAGVACEARLPLAACARAVLVDAAVSVVVQPVARLAALSFRRDVGLSALAIGC